MAMKGKAEVPGSFGRKDVSPAFHRTAERGKPRCGNLWLPEPDSTRTGGMLTENPGRKAGSCAQAGKQHCGALAGGLRLGINQFT